MALALMSIHARAQFVVSGKVTDTNNNAIVGASIALAGTSKGALTDIDGKFAINAVPKGKYLLEVNYTGFKHFSKEIEILSENIILDIQLSENVTQLEEVVVSAIRASEKDPVSRTNISKSDIEDQNLGQDLPILLNLTPSSVTTSDAGAGVGYTGIRIRGSDASSTNVTINGVPLNDAEDHGVYWVDIPDIASSTQSIQIQRGVGTSTNGAGSFGASMNMQTTKYNPVPYSEMKSTAGSFNTFKNTLGFGTGLLHSCFTFDSRISLIKSNGFIDRASSDLQSYFFSGGYYSDMNIIKINAFGGLEKTYQAWNGIPKVKLNNDTAGIRQYIYDNSLTGADSLNLVKSDPRKYNSFLYKNQTDNYQQNHYQIIYIRKFSEKFSTNATLHYTRGFGYYEEYKTDQLFASYLLNDFIARQDTFKSTNLIRRLFLDNDFYGGILSGNYSDGNTEITIGGALNEYYGLHYGRVIWAQNASNGEIDHQWYYGKGIKDDGTIYLKANQSLSGQIAIYADLQYRHISYYINGTDQNLRSTDQKHFFNFFNPKFGLTFKPGDNQSLYFYSGISQKEPTRANYVDRKPGTPEPISEKLYNSEFGYKLNYPTFSIHANYFLMFYRDQLVLTGALNDVGDPLMMNVKNSYRQGIELEGAFKVINGVTWNSNCAFSMNKINEYTNYFGVFNDDGSVDWVIDKKYKNVDIAFSPSIVFGSSLKLNVFKNIKLDIQSKYVSKQYIDNTQSVERMLNTYFVNNLLFGYSVQSKFWKALDINLTINNIFNEKYLTNGWIYRYIYGGKVYTSDGYFPQSGICFLAGAVFKF